MIDFLLTLSLFNICVFLLPVLCFSFIILKICRSIWISAISQLNPELEFLKTDTVRTLLDTHRNQGIISVLLSVKGLAQPEAVRRHLNELVRRKDKFGNLVFPRLKECLVTRCGSYAWQKSNFDLDQILTVANVNFKGRCVSDSNIQEYVSDIVSKYLPQNMPPWQVIIIPSSIDQHYILFKLHHLLFNEKLNIGDLLPLIPPTRQNSIYGSSKSPLVDIFKKPQAIPQLKERLSGELSNFWNELIQNYDPLENLDLLKHTPTFTEFMAICLITFASIIKECRRGYRVIKDDMGSKIMYTRHTIRREAKKRNVSAMMLIYSILASFHPKNVLNNVLKNSWYLFKCFTIQLPVTIYGEFLALYTCFSLHYCAYPHTFVGKIYDYTPLVYGSIKEIYYFCNVIFHAPRNIIQDILSQKETLQTITLCGRKSVAWTEPLKTEDLRLISKKTGISETEITLSAISTSLAAYLMHANHYVPEELPITLRNINSNYVFATGNNVRPEDAVSGIVCMNLPITNPKINEDVMANALEVKKKFRLSLEKQGFSHLLTIAQTRFGILAKFVPATFLSIYLKYLSRKFAVSVTEVTSRYPNVTQRTLWGQEVDSVIYWRPPQANTCISLCINEYADHIKLGVMCDSQLVPHHQQLVRKFTEHMNNLTLKCKNTQ